MSRDNGNPDDLRAMMEELFDDSISPERHAELKERLRKSDDDCRAYFLASDIHLGLEAIFKPESSLQRLERTSGSFRNHRL
jgi:hypothetical protein